MASALVEQYFRQRTLPHIWCPGCGNGILLRDVAQAIANLGLDQDEVCIFSGIGCSSRAAGYLDFNTMHTTHGRAIAFATGLKLAKPQLTVIVLTGDGDACAIGGNHLIHAARRNIDLTVVVFNNSIYGMTGGQYSPTTPSGEMGTTAPYGNIDRVFNLPEVARAAGATYTARGTVYHVPLTVKLIENAVKNKGFSLVECVTDCPTYYGRKNRKGEAVAMLKWQKENAVDVKAAARMDQVALQGKLVIGELSHDPQPELTAEYQKIIDRLRGSDNEAG
jgi:2-oxoglutarate ferredoxin oxidoreductase subunit beta